MAGYGNKKAARLGGWMVSVIKIINFVYLMAALAFSSRSFFLRSVP